MTTARAEHEGTSTVEYEGQAVGTSGKRAVTDRQREQVEMANSLIREAYELLQDGDDPVFASAMPVGKVQWIHIDQVQANDYNPNAVAGEEMRLLHTSIAEDGYTQPVVAI